MASTNSSFVHPPSVCTSKATLSSELLCDERMCNESSEGTPATQIQAESLTLPESTRAKKTLVYATPPSSENKADKDCRPSCKPSFKKWTKARLRNKLHALILKHGPNISGQWTDTTWTIRPAATGGWKFTCTTVSPDLERPALFMNALKPQEYQFMT